MYSSVFNTLLSKKTVTKKKIFRLLLLWTHFQGNLEVTDKIRLCRPQSYEAYDHGFSAAACTTGTKPAPEEQSSKLLALLSEIGISPSARVWEEKEGVRMEGGGLPRY